MQTQYYIRIRTLLKELVPGEPPKRIWYWIVLASNHKTILESAEKDYTSKRRVQEAVENFVTSAGAADWIVEWDDEARNPGHNPKLEGRKPELVGRYFNPTNKRKVNVYRASHGDDTTYLFWYRNMQRHIIPAGQFKTLWKKAD